MEAVDFILVALLIVAAFCYSSVGHGGASGYLAVLALFGIEKQLMRPCALLLNILVASIAFFYFARSGFFRWKLFYPFAVSSVPMAFAGGLFTIDAALYHKILGLCLILAVVRMVGFRSPQNGIREVHLWQGVVAGGVIGFISGLIGIGGGVLLSPLMLLMRWADVKQTAAVSALFIAVNSVSGLAGLIHAGQFQVSPQLVLWTAAATMGGLAGSYAGSSRFSFAAVRTMLALVLMIASLKLIIS